MHAPQHHHNQAIISLHLTSIEGYSEIYDNTAYGVSFTFESEDDSDDQGCQNQTPLAPFNSIQGKC